MNLKLVNRGPGQHISTMLLPGTTPQHLTADRVWIDRHELRGNKALYIVSHWGEAIPADGNVVVTPTTSFLSFIPDPGVAQLNLTRTAVKIDGEILAPGTPQIEMTNSALAMETQFATDELVAKIRFLAPSMHPFVYATVEIRSIGLLPDFTPLTLSVEVPGADPQTHLLTLAGCRCHLALRVGSNLAIPDPSQERTRAIANAGYGPHRALVVPVTP